MRICSLVPGATEVVAALGLADRLVGISHECDFPAPVRHAPVVVESIIDSDQSNSSAIDRQIKTLTSSGERLYRLNEAAFLAGKPDIVLTQDLCHVCAITPDQLTRAVRSLVVPPQLLALSPMTVEEVLTDIERIGLAVGRHHESRALTAALRKRLGAVQERRPVVRPRVLCLEWLSPLYVGGHWVPEMVELAGGQDVLGDKRQPSRETTWDEIADSNPDFVVLMPCGFSVERTMNELADLLKISREWSRALASWPQTFAVDAASYFSRPGPRLVDGVELLAAILSGTSASCLEEGRVRTISPSSFP